MMSGFSETTTMNLSDSMEDGAAGSDSDASLSDAPPDYYQPIAAVDGEDSDHPDSDEDDDGTPPDFQHLSSANGFAEDAISSLDVNGTRSEEEEEEERRRQDSDSAMVRAFREDEMRRNAPIPEENAARVMEAMRGISFGGVAPDWAGQVPENRWINQLRTLRPAAAPPLSPPENSAAAMEAMRQVPFPSPIQN